jgi:hypothetical protein
LLYLRPVTCLCYRPLIVACCIIANFSIHLELDTLLDVVVSALGPPLAWLYLAKGHRPYSNGPSQRRRYMTGWMVPSKSASSLPVGHPAPIRPSPSIAPYAPGRCPRIRRWHFGCPSPSPLTSSHLLPGPHPPTDRDSSCCLWLGSCVLHGNYHHGFSINNLRV